jgi:hypothetical protein
MKKNVPNKEYSFYKRGKDKSRYDFAMYIAKNTGVQSTKRTDFMNEVLLLLHVHYRNICTRGSKLQDVIIRVTVNILYLNTAAYQQGRAVWRGSTPPSPKFRSFDKAEPNSLFRGKYICNNLIRIRVSLICKSSGTLGSYRPQIPVFSALCP